MPAHFTTYPKRWKEKMMNTCSWCGKKYDPETSRPATPGVKKIEYDPENIRPTLPSGSTRKRIPSDFCSDYCEEFGTDEAEATTRKVAKRFQSVRDWLDKWRKVDVKADLEALEIEFYEVEHTPVLIIIRRDAEGNVEYFSVFSEVLDSNTAWMQIPRVLNDFLRTEEVER